MDNNYDWKFSKVGGVTRVSIETGEDIAHLDGLDQKMWTVLSCPTTGLEFDAPTLAILDSDADGHIRVNEVVAAAKWVSGALTDHDLLTAGTDTVPLSAIKRGDETGDRLYASALRILKGLGADKEEISIADVAASTETFNKSRFNGDGVITPAVTEDEALSKVVESIIATVGSTPDRSGEAGVTQEQIDAFFAACADYLGWLEAGQADKAAVFPYGDNTEAALAAVEAVKAKVEDYFMRSKLINFASDAASVLDVSVERIGGISAGDLSASGDEIATYPLARVSDKAELPLDAVNPAWKDAVAALKAAVLKEDAKVLTEAEWREIGARLAPYAAWKAARKGEAVEPLGMDYIKEVSASGAAAALADLVARDKALEPELNDIMLVDKLVHLVRWLFPFLRNFVTFSDFYDPACQAVFQSGQLYIDQRCCELCIKVTDMDSAGSIASLSGMYVLYCSCTTKSKPGAITIAAVVTDGDVNDLRVGKHAVFYDRDGLDWDSTIVKIIDNPISVRQAFFSPYKKLIRTISDRINKSASAKNDSVQAGLTDKANTTNVPTTREDAAAATAETKKAGAFDIAKFAGIFAAIGMAVGFLASALVAIIKPWYNILIVLLVLVLLISGPSMFLAWLKIRRRNISPVLNVNGWAMNATALVNAAFGATLTSLAQFPVVNTPDPYAPKKKHTLRNIIIILALLGGIFAALFFTDRLKGIGLPYHKDAQVEAVEEAPEAPAPGADVAAEQPAETPEA